MTIAAALAVATFAIVVATRGGRRQLIGTAIAATALAYLALAPPPATKGEETLLLTQGADEERLAESGTPLRASRSTYSIGRQPDWPRWIEAVRDTGPLRHIIGSGGTVVVAGHGLDPWDVERLTDRDGGRTRIVRQAVPPPPIGIRWIDWRRDLASGEPLVVTGVIAGSDLERTLIRLSGTGGTAEQSLEPADGAATFRLEVLPPGPGRFVFDVEVESDGRVSRAGRVDVAVEAARAPSLLWIESAPSFEAKHLKSWLVSAGGAVALRTMVSRGRFRYEFHNMERTELTRITADRLAPFDLLVVDSRSWAALPRGDREVMEAAVRNGDLGLVIRLDPEQAAAPLPFGASVRRLEAVDRLMVRPPLPDDPPEPIAIPPYELDSEEGETLYRDAAGRPLAERRRLGKGAVAVTLMSDSYRWVLEGRRDVHRAYWISLLGAVAPPSGTGSWLPAGGPVLVDEPITMIFAGDLSTPVRLLEPGDGEATVPMRQHPTRPQRFSATVWPRRVGWHQLVAGEAATSFYAAEPAAWEAWRLERRRKTTALAIALTGGSSNRIDDPPVPWFRLFALAALLGALAFVWVDERASS